MNVLEGLKVAIELLDNAIETSQHNDQKEYFSEAFEAVKSVYLQIKSRTEE